MCEAPKSSSSSNSTPGDDVGSISWTGLRKVFCPEGTRPPLPRSGYTKQPRALALGLRLVKGALKAASDVGRVGGIIREEPRDALRPPLSGRISATPDPGLEPWAVLYSRFAAKSHSSFGTKIPGTCLLCRLQIRDAQRSNGVAEQWSTAANRDSHLT